MVSYDASAPLIKVIKVGSKHFIADSSYSQRNPEKVATVK